MDHSDMVAITKASGIAAIKPIFAIALGIVSMICPICTHPTSISQRQVPTSILHHIQQASEVGANFEKADKQLQMVLESRISGWRLLSS